MEKTQLNTLLSNQVLILTYIKEKLEILNFIIWGYDNNLPILINNKFLHFTSHIYYRSIIVDICTLYDDNKHQHCNFHLLIKNKKFTSELDPKTIKLIKQKLTEANKYFTGKIKNLRNEEISHYKFRKKISISFNLNCLIEINALYKLAEQIIKIASDGFLDNSNSAEYKIGLSGHTLFSLQKLLNDVNGFDYFTEWKNTSPKYFQ